MPVRTRCFHGGLITQVEGGERRAPMGARCSRPAGRAGERILGEEGIQCRRLGRGPTLAADETDRGADFRARLEHAGACRRLRRRAMAGSDRGGDLQSRRCALAWPQPRARPSHRGGRPPRASGSAFVRRRAGGSDRSPRARSDRAGRLHAHPDARLRRALCRPTGQHPPVAAAGVRRPAHPSAGARSRLQAGRCDGAPRDGRPRPRTDHRAGHGAGAAATTTKPRWRGACSKPSTACCRARSAGWCRTNW